MFDTTRTCNATGMMVASFTASNAKLREELRVAVIRKRELCLESQRIASRLEPRALALKLHIPSAVRVLRQPPARFAFYQGDF